MIGLLDGLVAGAVAGIAQGAFAMMATLVMGQGFFWPLMLIGHMFRPYSENPDRSAGTILRGLLIHMIVTMMLGVVFALVAPLLPGFLPLWLWGMAYGALIWVVDRLGLLRTIDPTMAEKMNMGLFFLTHLVYGGVLGWWLQALPLNI